jgi:hypothetical protein
MLRGSVVLAMAARAAEMPGNFNSAFRASCNGAEDLNRLISGLDRMGVFMLGEVSSGVPAL